ncbi:MAG: glycoside hydrolase family 2 protein [Bacteroidales bacterium]|nr:glycoside hydrolase family 2 protein [Bacteroidales bacterium]
MKRLLIVLYISLLIFVLLSCHRSQVHYYGVTNNWQFKQDNSQTWVPAKVPGGVHTDLLLNDKIPDPFFGDNEQKLQWIGESGWTYKTTFDADNILENEHVELVFEGLDTYADVYLNDSLILTADNMFRQWIVEVKDFLRKGDNNLEVHFQTPEKIEQQNASQLPYQLPDPRGFTRKAPYQYGWDWGPKYISPGIWKPIYLQGWNDLKISNVHVYTKGITDAKAKIVVETEIESNSKQSANIILRNNKQKQSNKLSLETGTNVFLSEIEINNPKLWWPNGMGDHPVYSMEIIVQSGHSEDSRTVKFGIRDIGLIREKDSIGESFYFSINGIPFFAKGANYIPQDNFPSRVSDDKYRQTIQNAVDANMNMLRVWGGGIYEKDIFYDLCDENGILVWQDFMFACNMYPGDSAFLENVRQEAIYQVKRLRNHPSLTLWCGNNEVDEGWHNWGWQKSLNYSEQDSTEIWNNYINIFEDILPKTLHTLTPYLPYIPSSPKIGWGHKEALLEGDIHYWGVWWGEEPFEMYEKKVGRFMSEYGFQGFPDLRTLDSCLLTEDQILNSTALLNHQKHPRGMDLIRSYMEREFPVPDNFENYVYVSQLVQAYGIKKAIEAHRRAMPQCMGTLYWQLNDCWPVISWSSLDYYNTWKALHYFVRDAYKDFLISFEENGDEVSVFVVSDKQQDLQAVLDVKIIGFDGKIKWQNQTQVNIKKTRSDIYESIDITGISNNDHLITALLMDGDSLIAQNLYYLGPTKLLDLPSINITKEFIPIPGGFQITLSSDKLAKNVFLTIDEEGHFSDNYFDLLPGEKKPIDFQTENPEIDLAKKLRIITLNDIN